MHLFLYATKVYTSHSMLHQDRLIYDVLHAISATTNENE